MGRREKAAGSLAFLPLSRAFSVPSLVFLGLPTPSWKMWEVLLLTPGRLLAPWQESQESESQVRRVVLHHALTSILTAKKMEKRLENRFTEAAELHTAVLKRIENDRPAVLREGMITTTPHIARTSACEQKLAGMMGVKAKEDNSDGECTCYTLDLTPGAVSK